MPLADRPEILPSLKALLGEDARGPSQDLLDLLPVGIYVCDRDGRVVDYNRAAAEIWGRAPRRDDSSVRFCGSYRLHSVDGGVIPHAQCAVAEVLATGKARRDEEVVIERHDGTRLTALVSIEPLKDAAGRILGAVNVFRDHSAQYRKRQKLRRQGRRLDALLQAMPMAVYTTDAAGRITFFNEAAVELWGVRPKLGSSQFCGSWKLYWPDGTPLPHERCPMAMALKSGEPIRGMEAVAERPDGSRVPFLAYPTPLFDAEGRLTGAVNVLLNIADRHAIHGQLRSSEERYRTVFDNAQVSLWEEDFSQVVGFLEELRAAGVADLRAHLEADPDCVRQAFGRLRVTGVNACTIALFEAEHEDELLGRLDAIFVPETQPVLVEELVALWEGRRRFESEAVVRSLKGRCMKVVIAIAFEGERAAHSIATIQNVTQRKSSEQASQRLAAIVESSEDAIIAKNLDSIITNWNLGAQRLFGYTAEEAVGRPVTMLIPEDRQDEEAMILANIRRGERVDHYETLRRRKDGSLVNISLTVSPIKAADGTIIGASKIGRDITERTKAQAQQQLLLREMNHRVKNLITLTSGLVSLSARYAKTPADLAEAVQERLQALARAQDLILPKAGGVADAATRSTTLHALIWAIVSPYDEPQGDGSRFSVAGHNPRISGRAATSLALLLHEFATNAAKYGALSTETGHIEMDCSEDGGLVALVWREHGGPPVEPQPPGEGFGSVLSQATVEGQLKGELEREWSAEGLILRLSIPSERLAP